jgi:hypothetical protein
MFKPDWPRKAVDDERDARERTGSAGRESH